MYGVVDVKKILCAPPAALARIQKKGDESEDGIFLRAAELRIAKEKPEPEGEKMDGENVKAF